jgi:hypothetical protein
MMMMMMMMMKKKKKKKKCKCLANHFNRVIKHVENGENYIAKKLLIHKVTLYCKGRVLQKALRKGET